MDFVHEVIHDATQMFSNHHPSLIKIALQPMVVFGLKKSPYLKLDVDELTVESTIMALKEEWNTHNMVDDRDPRVNWKLGWKAICKRVLQIWKDKGFF